MNETDKIGGRKKWPIGGHIHISSPIFINKMVRDNNLFKAGLYASIKKIIDEYVAIPMLKVEGNSSYIRRKQLSYDNRLYGSYHDDYRLKGPHRDRLEYRTLSGQWLTHPLLAEAVLGTVKSIYHAIFKDVELNKNLIEFVSIDDIKEGHLYFKKDINWKNIPLTNGYGAIRDNESMKGILHDGKIKFTRKIIDDIVFKLKNLSTYAKYAKHIDKFIEIINITKKSLQKQETDLKKTWIEGQEFII
jgi:hypothetical protein